MGTNQGGINCFNGSTFSYITTENGLSDNVVYSIKEVDGKVLIGTNNGLTIIDGLDTLVRNVEDGLPHKGVVSIHVTESREVWLGTGAGTAKLVDNRIIPIIIDSTLSKSTILNIREGADGSIWFCTVQNGVFRFSGKDVLNITTNDGLGRNYVFDVMPIGKYEAWVFGYSGFYHWKSNNLEPMKQLPSQLHSHTIFYGYSRDKASNVWIGTSSGVLKYHDDQFSLLTTDNGLVHNNIWKILSDREGNIWFGSKSRGISKLTSERFKLYEADNILRNKNVTAVFRSKDNNLWVGTNAGISIWSDHDTVFYDHTSGLSSIGVSDLDQAADGTVYIALDYGFASFNDGELEYFEMPESDINECHDVFADGNTVWFGTKVGVAKFQDNKLIQPFNAADFSDYVFDAVRKDDEIWFAYNDGVLVFDGESFSNLKGKDGFFDGRTRSIALGPDGNLWFGTNSGVYVYDGNSCRNYNIEDGLISDAVYSLHFDGKNNLWVGQSKGLVRIILDGSEVQDVIQYQRPQGFLGVECHTNSIWADPDGKVWVGSGNGLVEYDPAKDKGLFYKPKTRITAVKLFSQQTDWSEYTDSITGTGIPMSPQIPYGKNNITFEFSGVSLTAPISMNYSWFLEGFDSDWSKVNHDNKAQYTNLPPGNYTFSVRAGFGDELWKNRPVSVSFTILAPFYRTNWFYALCLTIILTIAYSYYTIKKANVKITAQKEQIEKQKEVIERKNRDMVDSINYASTIQSATLPSDEEWFENLPNSFVLFRPKDIVSGDFYWMTRVNDDVFFAAVDCTGHGVPGALMSIIGYHGLNRAVNELGYTKPSDILKELSESVNDSLRKSEYDNYVKDGMDISLCKLNLNTNKLEFAGSVNPCLIVRNREEILLKGDRISIGSLESSNKRFANHEIQLQKDDSVFIYSDGYADQFGGADGKKMKTPVMRRKLVSVSQLSPKQQKIELEYFLADWKGEHRQVDDICVLGVKI